MFTAFVFFGSTQRHRILVVLAVIALAAIITSNAAEATFVDCNGLNLPMQGKTVGRVVLGDIKPDSEREPSEHQRLMLELNLEQRLSALEATTTGRIKTVLCPRHFPSESDYTPPIVRGRYRSGVLFELWGASSAKNAIVKHVLIPALLPEYSSGSIETFSSSSYDFSDPEKVFSKASDLSAYALLSLGLRMLHEANGATTFADRVGAAKTLGQAQQILCDARDMMKMEAIRFPLGSEQWADLADFALARSEDARCAARKAGAVPPEDTRIANCKLASTASPEPACPP